MDDSPYYTSQPTGLRRDPPEIISSISRSDSAYDDFLPNPEAIPNDRNPFNSQNTFNNEPQNNHNQSEFEARWKELTEKENELRAWEERLQESQNGNREKKANWPSKCWGLYYHAIGTEIPSNFRSFVRLLYLVWVLYAISSFLNLFTNIYYITNFEQAKYFKPMVLSCLYWFLGAPLAFRLWYWPHYCSFRDGNPPSTLKFNCMFLMHIVFVLAATVGMDGWGMVGWIQLSYLQMSGATFYISLTCCSTWSLCLIFSGVTLWRSTKIFARALLYREFAENAENVTSLLASHMSRGAINQ